MIDRKNEAAAAKMEKNKQAAASKSESLYQLQMRAQNMAQEVKNEPWAWWMKAKPDKNNNFKVEDLPPETFEPPTTPRGTLGTEIRMLTVKMQKAIDRRHIQKLPRLISKALKLAPTEMEYSICQAELMVKKFRDNEINCVLPKPEEPGANSSAE